MKLSVQKIDGAFHPKGESAIEAMQTLANQEYVIDVKNHRNPKFHRLFFALIKTIFDSQDYFDDMTVFYKYLIMKCGRVQIVDTPKGTLYLPESIAYESMAQEDFEKLYSAVITFAVREYGQEVNTLNNIMEFA